MPTATATQGPSTKGASPKREMLRRLEGLVDGLEESSHADEAENLRAAIRSLKQSVPADATLPEVVARTLATIVRRQVSLDGRLVSTLAHLAKEVGVRLADNPALLLAVALASADNPDREDEEGQISSEKSAAVDAVASMIVEDCTDYPYAEVVSYALNVATIADLHQSAEELGTLQKEIHAAEDKTRTMEEQVQQIAAEAQRKPSEDGSYGWAVKVMLTMLVLIAAAGAILEVLDDPVGAARRLWDESQ